MKALKKLAVFCVGAALTVGSAFGFAACDNGTDPQGYNDPNIREVYSLYVASAEESGNEPMTYEEWLASIKGEDGAPGEDGKNGKDGSSFLHGEGAPEAADGKAGDLYLDVLTGDLYEKDANGWSADPVGNLKGPKGDKGDSAAGGETEPSNALKTYDNVTITANGTYTLDVTGIEDGYYWLIAETETTAAADVLTVNSYGKTNANDVVCAYDMYSSTTQSFKGIVMVGCAGHDITVNNKSAQDITVDLKLVEYETITISAGKSFEVPCIPSCYSIDDYARIPVSFDNALAEQSVKVTFTYWAATKEPDVRSYDGNTVTALEMFNSASDKENDLWSKTLTFPTSDKQLLFLKGSERSSSIAFNAVVKIEEVS